ncbi:MAG: hypothetical protein PHW56_00095, partial [Methanosarcinaceae archaeon]|nr:hypothetical protein [Methanosarcinaceae archaeon]
GYPTPSPSPFVFTSFWFLLHFGFYFILVFTSFWFLLHFGFYFAFLLYFQKKPENQKPEIIRSAKSGNMCNMRYVQYEVWSI